MKTEVNLLLQRQEVKKKLKKLFLISVIFSSIIFFIAASLLTYSLFLKNSLANLQVSENRLKTEIEREGAKDNKKLRMQLSRERIDNIEKIASARKNLNTRVNSVLEILPENSKIESLNVNQESLIISLVFDNLYDVNLLLEESVYDFPKVYDANTKNSFAQDRSSTISIVNMETFGINTKERLYSLNLGFVFK